MTLTQFFNFSVMRMMLTAATGATEIPSGSGLAEDIFELFKSIMDWMVDFFGVFVGLFWTSTSGLTVLGVLAVIALGISIFFLIFAVVINFFHLRGR